MEIESIRHKDLRVLAKSGGTRGLIEAERLRRMLAFLASAGSFVDLGAPPNFCFHELTGGRKGTFVLAVTRNWRMTFSKDR